MPYCRSCKGEYNEGTDRCADCDTELAPGSPPKLEGPMVIIVWTDSVAAGVIQEELDGQGIPSALEPVEMSLHASPMGLVRIRVAKAQAKAALTVLEYLKDKHPNMMLDFTGQSERPPILPGF